MYSIDYCVDGHKWENTAFSFYALWAAVFKARAICEEHYAYADVFDDTTGVLLVSFNPTGVYYVDCGLSDEIKKLASAPLS